LGEAILDGHVERWCSRMRTLLSCE
jgi:hypothetical protein